MTQDTQGLQRVGVVAWEHASWNNVVNVIELEKRIAARGTRAELSREHCALNVRQY
jgi:hypothetical protein